jgi:hypothetical protein
MTNFRSEETRRHDGMAEVEGSKWFTGTMTIPSAPPLNALIATRLDYAIVTFSKLAVLSAFRLVQNANI